MASVPRYLHPQSDPKMHGHCYRNGIFYNDLMTPMAGLAGMVYWVKGA